MQKAGIFKDISQSLSKLPKFAYTIGERVYPTHEGKL